ncbi:MAG TPA: translocation/assembly module TamB domain-containing protein, partial [Burkholderiaceae bacterium]|nr:translocation/assembly module TamB domain-containing protein [Burkholderiaceae bacterium]
AQASYSGGRDGKLGIQINAKDHTHPQVPALSIAQAQLNIDGRLHDMQLNATAQTHNQTAYRLRATGGLIQHNDNPAWRGRVQQLTASGPLDAELTHAADLLISTQHLSIGPARLTVRDTQIDALRITWQRQQSFETSGRFTHWVIASSGIEGEPKLSLNGYWSARATHTLDAHLHIERSQGDLHRPTPTGRVAMGLDTLQLDARVQSNRLRLNAAVQGRHVGSLKAQLQAMLELPEASAPQTWRLAPEQSWSGQLSGKQPALEWLNPFLSLNLRDNIRVGGQADIQLRLAGTPRTPQLTGTIQAQALRLAWVEQGLRLDNGTLHATVAPGANGHTELILHQLTFSGQSRVIPQDRRIQSALAAINAQSPAGTLSAQGRIDLRTLEGLVQVQAERFPLLQRPDRWLIVTGGANYQFSRQRMQLDGAARADAGYIDITQRNAPTLSNDVHILRSADTEPARPREPRIPLDLTVGIDLGEQVIVRGAGLDTRATGSLLVKHAGQGLIRATGTIEAREGTYEGYGQKLNIARGRLHFQGPIENPSLDILALRPGLPVDVGVTITRSAANPLVRLYADPPMADFETLSWLVLGRPADETAGDTTALAQAAIGLLGGSGEGLPTQLARRLGIDEFSIRSAQAGSGASLLPRQTVAGSLRSGTQTVGGEIVYIGKRLSDQLTVSYETATTGAGNAVSLSYQLTRRLSLIARAGTESALDLVYSFAFD